MTMVTWTSLTLASSPAWSPADSEEDGVEALVALLLVVDAVIFRSIETRRHLARSDCLGKAKWFRCRESAGFIIAIAGPLNLVHVLWSFRGIRNTSAQVSRFRRIWVDLSLKSLLFVLAHGPGVPCSSITYAENGADGVFGRDRGVLDLFWSPSPT